MQNPANAEAAPTIAASTVNCRIVFASRCAMSAGRRRNPNVTRGPTLKTDTPQAGFDLAVKMSRVGVKVTQPSDEIRKELRAAYDHDTAQLIATSQVIAINFQTVAAANGYWRR